MDEATIMTIAWRDFVGFAVGHEPILAAFTRDTGISAPTAPKNGFEAMIDKATGVNEGFVRDFAYWATLTQWGDEGVPAAFLSEANARFPDRALRPSLDPMEKDR